jgi:hypothetical protein
MLAVSLGKRCISVCFYAGFHQMNLDLVCSHIQSLGYLLVLATVQQVSFMYVVETDGLDLMHTYLITYLLRLMLQKRLLRTACGD